MRQLERRIPLMNLKVKATLENFELADGRYGVEAVFQYNVARETLLKSMGVK